MGGAEVFTREVAKRWVKAGHEVTLFTSEFPHCRREEVLDGVRVVRAGGRFSVYWNARKYYKRFFSREGFEVVVDEINTRPFFAPKFVKNSERVVALIHQLAREYWFYETPFPVSYFGYYSLENRWLRNYVDVPTVTVSESTRQDLLDLGFKSVFIVPNGLSFEPLRKIPTKEEYPVVVSVGRLKRAKRLDHAVRAFEIVKNKIPDAELWIVGDGDARRDLERMAGDGVRFFGCVSDVERMELVKRAWVLVNPSVREGWGLNVVEANALGTPCVTYDVHGLRDSVKNNETGWLADAGNVDDLADKLVLVLSDGSLRKKVSLEALGYSKGFSWSGCAESFLRVLKSVVDDR
jgi:glycosyltransferase involved in cell wall biosynthesis